jgi:hypothetical protein
VREYFKEFNLLADDCGQRRKVAHDSPGLWHLPKQRFS